MREREQERAEYEEQRDARMARIQERADRVEIVGCRAAAELNAHPVVQVKRDDEQAGNGP